VNRKDYNFTVHYIYLLHHLQQTLKRIKVSWVGIDIEQVAVAVNEPVLE
jgi:hypothetical protein